MRWNKKREVHAEGRPDTRRGPEVQVGAVGPGIGQGRQQRLKAKADRAQQRELSQCVPLCFRGALSGCPLGLCSLTHKIRIMISPHRITVQTP